MEDLEKREQAYSVCGECNEPGTGWYWCRSCNAKRFMENFKNWTSGNRDIDELIQYSQLNAVCFTNCFEWIPFENFQNVTYITRGGFGKIYSAYWPEGCILYWDIENQKWFRDPNIRVVLKNLDNSTNINKDFLNEIKSYLETYPFNNITQYYGITQNPSTKDFIIVSQYCKDGNLRNYYLNKPTQLYFSKIGDLARIANGILDIHNIGKIHKGLHSGNILFDNKSFISDLGIYQPLNRNGNQSAEKEIYGVLPYIAPEVLREHQYTKAADIYSFGIIMNEYFSEEIPFHDIPHDYDLAVKICKGLRPKISEDIPKLVANLIIQCWDAKAENRPTAKDLYQILNEWFNDSIYNDISEIHFQINESEKIREKKLKNRLKENNPRIIHIHPQAIYISRLLNFKDLPEPVNLDVSTFQYSDDILDCLDCQINVLGKIFYLDSLNIINFIIFN
ncbi:kinase-like domain-containing protein [Glomus cerebriforme]|uniref:Kinase-like domain-containing protein n=1 Tax=Glomus cerebriforme TaxID=658196 RepID=A0A397TND0_9GLOM|nr:kinase-like domain-containing protein [Glomus cerebriforme]